MEKFLQDLVSPYWWISIVVMGLLLNLLSGYLKTWIDRAATRAFESYKLRQQARSDEFDAAASELAGDADAFAWMFQEETRLYFKCLRRTLLGIWLMAAGFGAGFALKEQAAPAWIGYVTFGIGYWGLWLWFQAGSIYQMAFRRSALLRRARELQVQAKATVVADSDVA